MLAWRVVSGQSSLCCRFSSPQWGDSGVREGSVISDASLSFSFPVSVCSSYKHLDGIPSVGFSKSKRILRPIKIHPVIMKGGGALLDLRERTGYEEQGPEVCSHSTVVD